MYLHFEKSPNGFYIINIGNRKYCWDVDDNKFSDMNCEQNIVEVIHNRYRMAMVTIVDPDTQTEILRQEINPIHASHVVEWVVDDQV